MADANTFIQSRPIPGTNQYRKDFLVAKTGAGAYSFDTGLDAIKTIQISMTAPGASGCTLFYAAQKVSGTTIPGWLTVTTTGHSGTPSFNVTVEGPLERS